MIDFNYIFGTVERKKIPEGALIAKIKGSDKYCTFLTAKPFESLSPELIKRYEGLYSHDHPLIQMPDAWGSPEFAKKLHDDVVDAMRYVVKNQSDKIKERKMDIKTELHKLVDGLDEEKYNTELLAYTFHKDFSIKKIVNALLMDCQKPLEKTLDQKLEDAGFKKNNLVYGIHPYQRKNIYVHIYETWVGVTYLLKTNKMGDSQLPSEIDDHDQIFADIAYLENKYAKKSDTL